uniref:NIDO domain-containing protein n=1 Tax=Plectus sambesii TaxID=2011161 RepID=A0A914XL52_9BILA
MPPVELRTLCLLTTLFAGVMVQQDLFGQRFSAPFNPFMSPNSQSIRITAENLEDIDWMEVDRRDEESWYHLYPFGERYFDTDLAPIPWNDQQIDLDFFFPYHGFRFNYSFATFSYPHYIQPPYTYPNPKWPDAEDMSFIASFMADQTVMHVGDVLISHLWYRIISRPVNEIGRDSTDRRPTANRNPSLGPKYRGHGHVEDADFLNQLTDDIRYGMVGARGFTADYAIVITWERMGYGGAPKYTAMHQYEEAKKWQNTYQMVLATDEIRSYAMFNYANINWTSSTAAGSLAGRGGKQSALVGFNGGNGTGFVQLPYSAEGNSYKLVQFGSTQTAGRWLCRVDEVIVYGGCTNDSTGQLRFDTPYGDMLGGFSLNVSGPCFREQNVIKLQIDELTIDCRRLDMVVARCTVPVNAIYRVGEVSIKLSTDGGRNYPFWNTFIILQHQFSNHPVQLINDPLLGYNDWHSPAANNLTLMWPAVNISSSAGVTIDISVWGYWEDLDGHEMVEVGRRKRNADAYD